MSLVSAEGEAGVVREGCSCGSTCRSSERKNEPSEPAGACSGGKFVVCRAGGAYDARD